MRLLHAETKQFAEFYDKIPPYAILSHRWGSNELSFKDVEQNGYTASPKTDGCCKQALEDGLEYVWIDTFCIDKSSSAELSEAINSMWAWYEGAEVCYAYLSDVPPGTAIYDHDSAFCKSQWFTRAWTLQELLVPRTLAFYDESWGLVGQKGPSKEFLKLLARVTQIPSDALRHNFQNYSVAQRMSWASHRATTRVEDKAYSLLGLFGIHMPLLYGEGAQAFKRLQEEIIKVSDDESIFAWGFQRPPGQNASLFAASPLDFENCGFITASATAVGSAPYSVTNKGLHIETSVCDLILGSEVVTIARLNCSHSNWAEEEKSLALVMETQSLKNHTILTRRCEAAPLIVPSNFFSESKSTGLYVHRSMGHWDDQNGSGLQIQCRISGRKATYNIQEFYPPSWRTILTTSYVLWDGKKDLTQAHRSIVFLVEDADRPRYMVSIEYFFRRSFANLTPVKVGFSAKFVEEGITLAEAIKKTAGAVRVRDGQETLDFGDSELRMHLNEKAHSLWPCWILDIDIVKKMAYTPNYENFRSLIVSDGTIQGGQLKQKDRS